jgi:hypothetical protein
MPEQPKDITKATGMCPHRNFPGNPDDPCSTHKVEDSAEESEHVVIEQYLKDYAHRYNLTTDQINTHFLHENDEAFAERIAYFNQVLQEGLDRAFRQYPDDMKRLVEYYTEHPQEFEFSITGSFVFGPKKEGMKQDIDLSFVISENIPHDLKFTVEILITKLNTASEKGDVQAMLGGREDSLKLYITRQFFIDRKIDLKELIRTSKYRQHLFRQP